MSRSWTMSPSLIPLPSQNNEDVFRGRGFDSYKRKRWDDGAVNAGDLLPFYKWDEIGYRKWQWKNERQKHTGRRNVARLKQWVSVGRRMQISWGISKYIQHICAVLSLNDISCVICTYEKLSSHTACFLIVVHPGWTTPFISCLSSNCNTSLQPITVI